MRLAIILGALTALAIAVPYPQDEPSDDPETLSALFPNPTIPIVLTTSLNIPLTQPLPLPTHTRSKRPHWEPIPIFTKECKCNVATVRYPCWATDSLQKCNYEENFSYGCYMEAAGGCPTPTRVCKNLFKPTPRPGPHPCELGGGPPPLVTIVPNITTVVTVAPTLNISLPVAPTGNVSLPVVPTNISLPGLPTASGSLPVSLPL